MQAKSCIASGDGRAVRLAYMNLEEFGNEGKSIICMSVCQFMSVHPCLIGLPLGRESEKWEEES